MQHTGFLDASGVHYRVGSLEINLAKTVRSRDVHYRVGSLENGRCWHAGDYIVHCRVGSLEIVGPR